MTPLQNTLFDLSNLCILKLLGDNAAEFLQGQISCNVNAVNASQVQQGAFCNLKGRILALVDVLKLNEALHLVLPKALLEKTEKSLSKTAALSRVTLEHDNTYAILGFYLHNDNEPTPFEGAWPHEKYACTFTKEAATYHLGDGYYILLVKHDVLDSIKAPFIVAQALQDENTWHALRLEHGDIQIYPESRGLFLPHRLNLHLSGHLDFDKGCYKGQEIIARTHYRAKLKHTLKQFIIEAHEPLQPGLRLMNEENTQEVGELVDFCLLKDKRYLVAASILLEHPDIIRFESHHTAITLQTING
ncbi:MAG: folate-binding protein YgfZ [Legionellaceae bacterium]|nr:folate-binding protein YgfZ [Legionellaceae bacterium]